MCNLTPSLHVFISFKTSFVKRRAPGRGGLEGKKKNSVSVVSCETSSKQEYQNIECISEFFRFSEMRLSGVYGERGSFLVNQQMLD